MTKISVKTIRSPTNTSQTNQFWSYPLKKNSSDILLVNSDVIRQASALRDKAIIHCNKQEYFDVLKKCQKASSLFKMNDHADVNLNDFKKLNHFKAYEIMAICYIYSSIAYLQLSQYDQAILLLNEVIKSDPERV